MTTTKLTYMNNFYELNKKQLIKMENPIIIATAR